MSCLIGIEVGGESEEANSQPEGATYQPELVEGVRVAYEKPAETTTQV